MSKINNHSHNIDDFANLSKIIDDKSDRWHNHKFFSHNQLILLRKMLKDNSIFKKIEFNILNDVIYFGEPVILCNLKVYDFKNNVVDINFEDLYLIFEYDFVISFKNLIEKNHPKLGKFYEISSDLIGKGIHKFCIKYGDSYSEDFKIFIMEKENLLDSNVWSATEYLSNFEGFISGQGQYIVSSDEWSFIGEKSLKIILNKDFSTWTDIPCPIMDNGVVLASGKIFTKNSVVSIYFVCIDNDGKEFFSDSIKIYPSESPQSFSLNMSVAKDIEKIHLRFHLNGEIGDFVYIDNIKLCTNNKKA